MEAALSREVTFEPESYQAQQETEEAEQFEYILSEEEDIEGTTVEAGK